MEIQQQSSSPTIPELAYHEALGIMLWLCNHADYRKTWPLWAVDNDLVPLLIHRQFRLYFDEHRNPVGCATWAWLSEKMKNEMIAGGTLEFEALIQRHGYEASVVMSSSAWGPCSTAVNELSAGFASGLAPNPAAVTAAFTGSNIAGSHMCVVNKYYFATGEIWVPTIYNEMISRATN